MNTVYGTGTVSPPSSGPERVDGNIHTRTERYSMFGINRMRVINYQPSYPTDSSLVYPISYTVYLCCAARYLLFKKESSCRCSERVELFRAGLAPLTKSGLMSHVAGRIADHVSAPIRQLTLRLRLSIRR